MPEDNNELQPLLIPHRNHFGNIKYCSNLLKKNQPKPNVQQNANEHYMIVIKLRPFAQALLLDPKYSVMPSANNENILGVAKLAFPNTTFKCGSANEGNAPGFIGMKSEAGKKKKEEEEGNSIFSLCFGDNIHGKILLSTIVDDLYIEKVIVNNESELHGNNTSNDYISLDGFNKYRKKMNEPLKQEIKEEKEEEVYEYKYVHKNWGKKISPKMNKSHYTHLAWWNVFLIWFL